MTTKEKEGSNAILNVFMEEIQSTWLLLLLCGVNAHHYYHLLYYSVLYLMFLHNSQCDSGVRRELRLIILVTGAVMADKSLLGFGWILSGTK